MASMIERDKAKTKRKSQQTERDALLKAYRIENDRLRRANTVLAKVGTPLKYAIKARVTNGKHEACPVIVWSDWHIDELIRSEEVNGVNEFNLEIADQRLTTLFQNTLKLLEIVQRDSQISEAVLALLGDYIAGNIHEELAEGSQFHGPVEAILEAQKYITAGIQLLLDNTKLTYTVVCKVGNHSRITQQQRHATEAEHSLEWFMYWQLKNHFRDNPRLKFVIESGYLTYLPVYNYTLRFHHGHDIAYYGGSGGITIPTKKAIEMGWNKQRVATLDVFGHWHQFIDGGNFLINGSVVGYNAYAVRIKASFEVPRQAFFLVDRDRGKSVVAPIWVT